MTGKFRHVGVVENRRVGDDILARKRAVEPIAQFHRHQRVHPQIEEADRQRRQGRQPHHRLQFFLQERCQDALGLGRLRDPQLGQQIRRRFLVLVGTPAGHDQQFFQEPYRFVVIRRESRPVHRRHHARRNVLSDQRFESPQALLRGDPARPRGFQLPGDAFALLLRLAELRPGAPGDGQSGQAQGAAVAGELVEEGIGRGVIGLSGIAQDARDA